MVPHNKNVTKPSRKPSYDDDAIESSHKISCNKDEIKYDYKILYNDIVLEFESIIRQEFDYEVLYNDDMIKLIHKMSLDRI